MRNELGTGFCCAVRIDASHRNINCDKWRLSWVDCLLICCSFLLWPQGLFAQEQQAVCADNNTASAHAQCKIDSPASYNLGWTTSPMLTRTAKATVAFDAGSNCSGTLVSTSPRSDFTYLLTAAHCFPSFAEGAMLADIKVWVNYRRAACGSVTTLASSQDYFNATTVKIVRLQRDKDIALLLFSRSVDDHVRQLSIERAVADPTDFALGQHFVNPHHPHYAPLRIVDAVVTIPSANTLVNGVSVLNAVEVDQYGAEVSETGSSGYGLFIEVNGKLQVRAVASETRVSKDYPCIDIFTKTTPNVRFAKVLNDFAGLSNYLNPTSSISVHLGAQILADASVVQLHAESGATVDGAVLGIFPTTTFTSVPTGTYYVDVYGWDMRIATSVGAPTKHDRNACAGGEFDFVVTGNRILIANFSCDYKLGSYIAAFARVGGASAPASVTAGASCGWVPTSTVPWIQVIGSGGSGNGSFSFTTQANTTGVARTGSVTVGTQSLLVQQVAGCLLDIDGDSLVTPSKDAPLLIRYLLGFRGAELISGFTLGSRDTAKKIEDFMGSGSQFDVFGRSPSAPNAMTDGLVLSRLMLGVSDANLLGGVQVPAGAQFATASAIRANVNLQCGTAY